jgi:hypothetical protein
METDASLQTSLIFRQQYLNSGTGCVCQNTKQCKITGEGNESPEVVLN